MRKRLPTAFFLILIVYLGVKFLPLLGFFLFLQIVIILALYEFYKLLPKKVSPQIIIGFIFAIFIAFYFYYNKIDFKFIIFIFLLVLSIYYLVWIKDENKLAIFPSSLALTFLSVFYVSFTLNHLFYIQKKSSSLVLFLLTVVYLGDTGAYMFGKLWGKRKLVPIASPNKTWEGAIGGVIFSILGAIIGHFLFLKEISVAKAILSSIFISFIGQLSDPVESLFKRVVKVKDSSSILPGHGGILDRIDSLILAAPFFYYYIIFIWKL
ncbi:phosphatidate cytidylyltransferase [Candidatus Aminicenantes bacterium AC-335-K20]|nr:phosphatidate cytidylyltransferase [Candidatus Aminicenantes bacterium AC-335-K20]